jgi:two-component system OmpR family response regulator
MTGPALPPPWRVVVADDDEDTRLLIATSFRRAGFAVLEAANGVELLDSFAQEPHGRTLVVSDIGMPEMDGITATDALRRTGVRTPILLVTAFGDERTLRDARAAGADRVLLKPLDFSDLLKAALELIAP